MGYGEHILTLNVIDALGATASATGIIMGSSEETNTAPPLPRLNLLARSGPPLAPTT